MRRALLYPIAIVALVGLGWSFGRAPSPAPEFVIVVKAPDGQTTVECRKGCELVWAERGLNPRASPQTAFTFACHGQTPGQPCSSGAIAGWVRR